jgi:hypothetical protein
VELEKLLSAPKAGPALAWASRAGLLPGALGLELDRRSALAAARGPFDHTSIVSGSPEERGLLRLALLASRCGLDPPGAAAWLAGRRFAAAVAARVARWLELAGRAATAASARDPWPWVRDAGADATLVLTLAARLSARPRERGAIAAHARAAKSARTPPRVNGADVIAWSGAPAGPAVGAWLRELEIAGLSGEVRTRGGARKWLQERISESPAEGGPTKGGGAGL